MQALSGAHEGEDFCGDGVAVRVRGDLRENEAGGGGRARGAERRVRNDVVKVYKVSFNCSPCR